MIVKKVYLYWILSTMLPVFKGWLIAYRCTCKLKASAGTVVSNTLLRRFNNVYRKCFKPIKNIFNVFLYFFSLFSVLNFYFHTFRDCSAKYKNTPPSCSAFSSFLYLSHMQLLKLIPPSCSYSPILFLFLHLIPFPAFCSYSSIIFQFLHLVSNPPFWFYFSILFLFLHFDSISPFLFLFLHLDSISPSCSYSSILFLFLHLVNNPPFCSYFSILFIFLHLFSIPPFFPLFLCSWIIKYGENPWMENYKEIIINLYINLACLSVCLSVCLFVCLYPINVKTAETIGPKFFVGHHVTTGKVYEW